MAKRLAAEASDARLWAAMQRWLGPAAGPVAVLYGGARRGMQVPVARAAAWMRRAGGEMASTRAAAWAAGGRGVAGTSGLLRSMAAAAAPLGMGVGRAGEWLVLAIHGLLLQAGTLNRVGRQAAGPRERQFVRYFQEQHGWVYSGWCWSMCAIYVLVAWKMAAEAEWLQLAFTPLWMWMYVLVTAFDLCGATCRYRRRAEALSAVMHLSHVAAKALGCAGVPAYPLPAQPRRLYWMDVLACAMLSAVCEPVRVCIALPARLTNLVVSTVLYVHTGTAPTISEALLLSCSCHGLGLLLQHTLEAHYRRGFELAMSAAAATAAVQKALEEAPLSLIHI